MYRNKAIWHTRYGKGPLSNHVFHVKTSPICEKLTVPEIPTRDGLFGVRGAPEIKGMRSGSSAPQYCDQAIVICGIARRRSKYCERSFGYCPWGGVNSLVRFDVARTPRNIRDPLQGKLGYAALHFVCLVSHSSLKRTLWRINFQTSGLKATCTS